MKDAKKIVILGAGPCGLGAAWQLQKRKYPSFAVYERAGHAGGLSSSFTDENGFTWDIGGHVFHTTDAPMKRLFATLTKNHFHTYKRHASVLVGSTLVSYPFQYALSELPEGVREACEKGLANTNHTTPPRSFYDWIVYTFGSGMAKYFFIPYNTKLWRYPLKNMGWQWINERIATAHDKHKGTSWGRNAYFSVPAAGGIGSVFGEMARQLGEHIVFGKQAIAIDAGKKQVTFSDGSSTTYEYLFSTIPITTLTKIINGVSLPATSGLASCGVAVIGIGMKGNVPHHLKDTHWIYVPSPTEPFFRVSVYSNYGTHNAPSGAWSLLFEVSYDGVKKLDKNAVIKKTIEAAVRCGFIPSVADIIDRFYLEAPFAYPVPSMGRDAILSRVMPILESHDIFSRGRFGLWKYEEGNMDHVIRAGMAWVDEILKR